MCGACLGWSRHRNSRKMVNTMLDECSQKSFIKDEIIVAHQAETETESEDINW